MPAPTDAAMPTRKVSHVLQQEHASCSLVLLVAFGGSQDFLSEFLGRILVPALDLREFQQQLPGRSIARGVCRTPVEPLGLKLHGLGELPDFVEIELRHQPQRVLRDEPLDVLAADQRQVLAELRAVKIKQHGAMAHLFVRHLLEHLGGGWVLAAKALGKAAINPAVFVLVGDRQREDFLFGEIGETFHTRPR
jgi:hypothetical protein